MAHWHMADPELMGDSTVYGMREKTQKLEKIHFPPEIPDQTQK